MQKSAQNTAIAALLALGSLASATQAGANPWNPFPANGQATQLAAPQAQPQVQSANQSPVQSPVQSSLQPEPRSRFAPAGLEQQLAAAPLAQYAVPDNAAENANMAPPRYAPTPQQGRATGGYAPQGPASGNFAPYAFNTAPGYAPNVAQYPGYGGYPQGYGGYRQGNSPFNNQGFGGSVPFSPFAIPGGVGGFNPFPGNITNGGVPGFNMTPFGLF